jgi:hypothetical protein
LTELIDAQLPKRDQGLSVGQYLLLAALNRAVAPSSKSQLARWHRQSILTRLLPATTDQLSERLVRDLKLNLRTLVYDGTNFLTYINTRNPATLPARGHNKQKRGDLRQVNLGMLVSTDFHGPLFHKVHTGNVNDTTAFQTISQELSQRYRQVAQGCEHITLVFDKGNNSAQAFEVLDSSPFHFIGSLVPIPPPKPRGGARHSVRAGDGTAATPIGAPLGGQDAR